MLMPKIRHFGVAELGQTDVGIAKKW